MLGSAASETISTNDLAVLGQTRAHILRGCFELSTMPLAAGDTGGVVHLAVALSRAADCPVLATAAGVGRVSLAECVTSTVLRTAASETISTNDLAVLGQTRAHILRGCFELSTMPLA